MEIRNKKKNTKIGSSHPLKIIPSGNISYGKWPLKTVDLPIINSVFFHSYVKCLPEGNRKYNGIYIVGYRMLKILDFVDFI